MIGSPKAMKAACEEVTEEGADGNAGNKVSFFRDGGGIPSSVVAVGRVVEALPHIVLEGNWAVFRDVFNQELGQVSGCPRSRSGVRKGQLQACQINGFA